MVSGMETNNNTDNLNADPNTTPSPQFVGREFVRQYYTILNAGPQLLHRFYSDDSTFVHGSLDKPGEVSQVVRGQEDINKKIISLNFKDCHAKILQVDSMETIGKGVVIQVTGELSNNRQPMRKFLQTFVLAPQSSTKFYVKNDIFRYQDEIFLDDDEYASVEKSSDVSLDKTEVPPLKPVDREEKELRDDSVVNVSNENYENTNGSVHEIIPSNVEKMSITKEVIEKQNDLSATDNFESDACLKSDEFCDRHSTSPQPQGNDGPKTYANMVSKNPNANFPPFSAMTTYTTATKAETTAVSAPFPRPSESPTPVVIPTNQTASVPSKPPPNNNSRPPKENRERIRRDRQDYQSRRNDSREMTPGRPAPTDSDDDFRDKKQYPDENQVFVGNLPQHIIEENLRDLFAKFGKILDVRINRQNQKMGSNLKTPNYGFVTFENPDVVQQILKQKPIYFDNHRFNVEEKRSQTGRGGPSFRDRDRDRDSNRRSIDGNRSQTGGPSGNPRNRNQFSGNIGPRDGGRGGGGGGGGSGPGREGRFDGNRNASNRQNR